MRGASTSARLAPLADKVLALLAQFTHPMLLALNQALRQVPSAYCSCCSLIQHFQETLIAQNYTQTERCHLPIAHFARSFSALGRTC